MTTIGHSLSGLSIAVLTLPRGRSLLWYVVAGHLFVFFANIPDYPFPGWGHEAYQVSHSIFLTWPPFTDRNRRVFLTELGVYGVILAGCVWIRSRRKSRNLGGAGP